MALTQETARWAVRYTRYSQTGIRPCESLDHARNSLRGLPPHYLPARVVTRTGDGQPWVPFDGKEVRP